MNFGGAVQLNRNALIIFISIIFVVIVFYRYNSSDSELKLINLKELLSASIDASIRGGKKVFEIREQASLNEKSKGKTKEGANNPVTDGDMLSHLEMYHSLKKAFPYIKIISEEKTTHKFDDLSVGGAKLSIHDTTFSLLKDEFVNPSDIRIWIDPLDATQEYTENLREYVTTMVCVAVRGVPIIGVIHKPFLNLTYWAWTKSGHSSTLTSPASDKGGAKKEVRIIVSRSHKGEVEEVAKEAFGSGAVITSAGGAGYKTLEVLSGKQDVYVHTTLIKKWDMCAGNAILNHFGGKQTTLQGDEITYGDEVEYKNPGGLIASLFHHGNYVEKLKALNKV